MTFRSKVEPLIRFVFDPWFASFLKENDLQWIICGMGRYYDELKNSLNRSGIAQNIQLPGYIVDMYTYYSWCDVLVHLSDLDAFPNVTMEAMSLCKPVIVNSTSCGALEHVIHDYNGFIVKDGASLVQALTKYTGDVELRRLHGHNGKRLIDERYSISVQRERMQTVLNDLFSNYFVE